MRSVATLPFSMAADELVVHGAREHNLKDITVRLPRNALICITGLSGSGKSSLAFDTIYAEGQRRYVESLSAYARQFLQMPAGTRFTVNAPVVRDRKGEYRELLEDLRQEGFTRVKVDGEQRLLDEPIELDKKYKHTIEVVVDRLVMKPDLRTRLAQSVETGPQLAGGPVAIDVGHTREHPPFSFNSPHGACPRCTGLGAQQEIDPDLLVPDPTLSIAEGALVPWTLGNSSFYESVIQAIADRYEIDLEAPWQSLSEEEQNY